MRDLALEKELKEKGYVSWSSDSETSMLEVAQNIGKVLKVPTMPLVQTLTPRQKENELENTYSGNFGLEEFPFHTDLAHWYIPPRYLFLRCVIPTSDVETKLIDSRDISADIEDSILSRSHFKPRKRLDRSANLLKVKQGEIFRWDSIFIKPANSSAEELKLKIQCAISSAKYISLNLDRKGECLLVDNWRMLHGRSAVRTMSMDRKIERVYFDEVMI